MIPLWALRFMPYLLAVLGLIGGAYWVGSSLIERGRNEIRPQLEQALKELDRAQREWKKAEDATYAYQSELSALRNRPRNTNPVRLCVSPAEVRPDATTTRTNDRTSSTWEFPRQDGTDYQAGADIGPELRGLALQCDEVSAQLRALQLWARE